MAFMVLHVCIACGNTAQEAISRILATTHEGLEWKPQTEPISICGIIFRDHASQFVMLYCSQFGLLSDFVHHITIVRKSSWISILLQ